MELYDSMSANKGSSIISGNDASNRDSMLDGKNLLFMTGFSAGMLFFYLAGDTFCKEAGQMYLETLRQIKRMDPAMEGLFLYILKSRIRQALLLFILATGKLSKPVFYIVFAIAGFITGILMLIAAYQLGFLGILISVGMVFPQMIFYFMAFKLMFEEYYYSDTNNYHKSNAN